MNDKHHSQQSDTRGTFTPRKRSLPPELPSAPFGVNSMSNATRMILPVPLDRKDG